MGGGEEGKKETKNQINENKEAEQKKDLRYINALTRVTKLRGNDTCCVHTRISTRGGVIYSVFDAWDLHTAFLIVLPPVFF